MTTREGTTQYWSESQERFYERLLASSTNQAMRNIILTIRDLVKYDQRTKEGKRAMAQARLRLATATDEELADLATLLAQIIGQGDSEYMSQALERLKGIRQRVRERGIRKEELFSKQGVKRDE